MIKGDAAIMLQEKLDALNWLLTQKIKKHFMYNTFIFFQTLQRYRIFIDSLFPHALSHKDSPSHDASLCYMPLGTVDVYLKTPMEL